MKRVPRSARKYTTILLVIAIILVGLCLSTTIMEASRLFPLDGFPNNLVFAVIIFTILAIIMEFTAVEIPQAGYLSSSFIVYFAFFVHFEFYLAVIIATIALLARTLITSKQLHWVKRADFSTNIISVTIAALIFDVANNSMPFLSLQNIGAMFLSLIVYYFMDFFLAKTTVSLYTEEVEREWSRVQKKNQLLSLLIAPASVILAVVTDLNIFLVLLAAPPLYVIQQVYKFNIRDVQLVDQEKLQKDIDKLNRQVKNKNEAVEELSEDLDRKIEEQEILVEMGEALGTSVNTESTLEIIVSMIRKMIIYQSCVIFLIEDGALVAAKSVTPYKDILEYSSLLKLEESIINLVVQNKKPILIPDMQSMNEQRIFKNERSVICVPLIVKNEIIGVVYVGGKDSGTYNEEHLHLLTILGNSASNAIQTAQLYEQTEQKNNVLEALNTQLDSKVHSFEMLLDIGQKLSSSLNIEEAQKIIIDGLEDMFNYQSAAVFLIKEHDGNFVLVPTKFRSPYELFFENLELPLDDQKNIMGWLAHYRKPLLLVDTRDTKIQTILENERCVMVVPMIVENEITGVIYVGHSQPDFYNEDALSLLEAVAHNSAMAIKTAEIFERTAIKAITDGLTGLYLHRYFQERLSEELESARRNNTPLALVMIDADHFKALNDTMGHPEGDACLKTLADLMKMYTRDTDIVCRIGGDEFTILLKEIDKRNAVQKAEAIRQAVQSKFHNNPVQITTSIGLACFPEDADNKKDLIAAADAALYKSKKLGRNRVSVATGPVTDNYKKEPLPRD
ncbi:MAG: sensor domain-containing diguanylate cyclase [Vulcanimicrobiota bacterium]